MEGLFWGVAAMVVKDALKQPYMKGRDYERNVRQVYRDVDNLKITMSHVRTNCTPEDLTTGPHATFIRRAESQLRDSYRTLEREYPRKAGLSRLMEHATTPGAEMNLLDIGKEANQTARGLGDLLSEIRFARMGKSKQDGKKDDQTSSSPSPLPLRADRQPDHRRAASKPRGVSLLRPEPSPLAGPDMYGVHSDGFGSPRSLSSGDREGGFFDRPGLQPSGVYSPPLSVPSDNSHVSSSSSSSSSRRRQRHRSRDRRELTAAAQEKHNLLPLQQYEPLEDILKSKSRAREREAALDNLQYAIDNALRTQASSFSAERHEDAEQAQEEEDAMQVLEYALYQVLHLQRKASRSPYSTLSTTTSSGSGSGSDHGSSVDQDLFDAVEDLDEAMKALVAAARSERDKKSLLRRVSRALEALDAALAERKRYQARAAAAATKRTGRARSHSHSAHREGRVSVLPARRTPRGRSSTEESRRSSMYD